MYTESNHTCSCARERRSDLRPVHLLLPCLSESGIRVSPCMPIVAVERVSKLDWEAEQPDAVEDGRAQDKLNL